MAVYFSTDDRSNKRGDYLIRLSWHHHHERFQTTTGLTTISGVSQNEVKLGNKKNSKNMTPDEINSILKRIENFINKCEAYALEKGVRLMHGTMRGLFKDYKAMKYTCEQEIIDRWLAPSPSNGLYWHRYNGGFYKKICDATDCSDPKKHFVIYQELFGHSRIFSMPLMEFTGTIEHEGKTTPRFVEVTAELALQENSIEKERLDTRKKTAVQDSDK